MAKDIKVTEGSVLESINNKADLDGGNYLGSGLSRVISKYHGGVNLFDTIVKDHVLTYEESRGLALQGTWVYKTAIAGERYGYPDFYNKCLEEYNDAANTISRKWHNSNVKLVGSVTHTEGHLRGFSASNYATLPNVLSTAGTWEARFRLSFSAIDTNQYAISMGASGSYSHLFGLIAGGKFSLWVSSNNTSWDMAANTQGTHTVAANTTYFIRYGYTGTEYYLDYSLTGEEDTYIRDITVTSSSKMYQPVGTPNIGCGWSTTPATNMIVNLNDSYITVDGDIWWTGTGMLSYRTHTNGHMFYDTLEKNYVDDFFNDTGMFWMYGIDEENERIFLPRNMWFDQFATSDVGTSVEAGLPNITGKFQGSRSGGQDGYVTASGAFRNSGGLDSYQAGTTDMYNMSFDASRSSSIYGNSDTVQPNAVKKLLYICVGTVLADTSWIDTVTQVVNGTKDIEDKRVQALTDLTNKENAGLSALANASNALRTTQITNCLTEVPQRIKYTLENGTLTIKAGSVVIVPYGTEDLTSQYPIGATFINDSFKVYDTQFSNGKFFVWAELVNDSSQNIASTITVDGCCSMSINKECIWARRNLESGTSATTASKTWTIYYNTDTNLVGQSGDTTTLLYDDLLSLPLMIYTSDGTNAFGSIKQVFQGMGYIGSVVWVDKGVKCLIPNGRNKEGTLNNIEHTTSKVGILNAGASNTKFYVVIDTSKVEGVFLPNYSSIGNTRYYDFETNYWYINATNGTGGEKAQWCMLSGYVCTGDNNIITSANFNKPFRAMDSNEVPHITENYVNGTSWYRVWSDGWCEQGGIVSFAQFTTSKTLSVTFLQPFTSTSYSAVFQVADGGNNWAKISTNSANRTTTGMNISEYQADGTGASIAAHKIIWYAYGY